MTMSRRPAVEPEDGAITSRPPQSRKILALPLGWSPSDTVPAMTARGGDSLRILYVSARYPPFVGGTEIHTAEVARRMVGRGHEVTVLDDCVRTDAHRRAESSKECAS